MDRYKYLGHTSVTQDVQLSLWLKWHENRQPHSHPNAHIQLFTSPMPLQIPCYFQFFSFMIVWCRIKASGFHQYSHYSVPECWCVSICPLSGTSSPDLTKSAPLSRDATLWWREEEKVSQLKSFLPDGAELRSLFFCFFSIPTAFISSWVAVSLLLCGESVVLNKSILLSAWLALLGFGDTLELILGEELTHQYFLNNLGLILNCDLHPNIFNLEISDTTVDLSSTPSATYDSFTSTTK